MTDPTLTELHDAGEPHNPDRCPRCVAAAARTAGRALVDAFAKLADALSAAVADAFARGRAEETPRELHGPRPRRHRARHRAPRQHHTNTVRVARSHQPAPRVARRRGYRVGGGR